MLLDRRQQLLRVPRLGHHREPGHLHHLDQPDPQQHGVLGDHGTPHIGHGSSTLIMVGPPTGLLIRKVPSTDRTRWASPFSPVPRDGSAPPGPSSATTTRSISPSRVTVTSARVASRACLAMFVSASETTK